jgi:hypothetical protein
MEGLQLGASPKFKSPEEEIAFLRSKIAEREKQIEGGTGGEAEKVQVTQEVIEAYKVADAKDILHEARVMPEHKVEELVLKLKPETHDRKMEELLGILMDQGIKTAMDVVAGLQSPHVDNDFHRFLVQYLHATHGVPGLTETNPMWKGIDMKLFEITLPEEDKDHAKGYKEIHPSNGTVLRRHDECRRNRKFITPLLHIGNCYFKPWKPCDVLCCNSY